MFEWKVEDMKLLKEYNSSSNKNLPFRAENALNEEEKLAFIDKMQEGRLGYIIELMKKLNKDKPNLPKDNWGDNIKTVSLKAWLKRNDTRHIVDTDYHYGEVLVLSERVYIQCGFCDGFINKIFHRQLCECLRKEMQYFKTHDEYEILKTSLKEKANATQTYFGVKLGFSSSGAITIWNDNDEERPITIEEIKDLLEKYDRLEKYIASLTAETHIVY